MDTQATQTINIVLSEVLKMHGRFDVIGERFKSMDQHFENIDLQLNCMDQRFDSITQRFDKLERRMDDRMNELEAKIDTSLDFTREMTEYLGEKVFDHDGRLSVLEDA